MTVRIKFLDNKSANSLGSTLLLNQNGISDTGLVVSHILIRNKITLGGVPTGALDSDDVGRAKIASIHRKTNEPHLNNVSYKTLDLICKRNRSPAARGFDTLASQSAIAGVHYFDFVLPLRSAHGRRPEDFCLSLDEIGQYTVQLPSTLAPITAGMTLVDWTVEMHVVGYDAPAGAYEVGALTRVDELTAETGLTVELNALGRKIQDLFCYSDDPTTSPISGNRDMRVELDGREIINARGLTGAETLYLFSALSDADNYSDFVSPGGYNNTLLEQIIAPSDGAKISAMPEARIIRIAYGARLVAPSDARFVMVTMYPGSAPGYLQARIPGADVMPPAVLESVFAAAGIGGLAPDDDGGYLPGSVKS